MTSRASQEGSASLLVLAGLLLCAAAAAGGVLVIEFALAGERRSGRAYEARMALIKETARVIALLADDETPEADSPSDEVWRRIKEPSLEGAEVGLEDVSSALNPNWAQKSVFEKTELKSLLKGNDAADELQQRREDKGFSMDLDAAYGDLFEESALPTYFTAYGYANINTTDEFALRSLYALRTQDAAGAEIFHAKVQGLLQEKRMLTRERLRDFLGTEYDELFPVMNAEPIMNVHFMNHRVLRELLAYSELKVPDPDAAAAALLDAAGEAELGEEELKGLIGAPEESRIYQYLGVNTWFWRITVRRGTASARTIVARVPVDGGEPRKYMIVEQRTSP